MSGVLVQKAYSLFTSAPVDGGIEQPSFEKLQEEVAADPAITTALVSPFIRPYDMNVPDVGFQFAGALSAPEVTALDILIAAHTGVDPVRGTDTHTFVKSGVPGISDDDTVIGVGGLPKYSIGDFIFDSSSGPPFDLYVVSDLTTGAAVWTKQASAASGGLGATPSLLLIATMDAIAVSTSTGPINYDSADLSRIDGFFTYSSPTLTCVKACRVSVWPRLDSTVNSGSSRSGIRMDILKNGSIRQSFDNNSRSDTVDAPDTQNNASDSFDMAVSDTIEIYCASYVTGLSDVWGGPNRLLLHVTEGL